MIRSIAAMAAMTVVASASAQSTTLTRTDSLTDSVQLVFQTQSKSSVSPSAANIFLPSASAPTNTYGYATTAPTTNARRPTVVNELYNRTFFAASNVELGYTGTANGHTFVQPTVTPQGLVGSVQFVARYNSSGLNQRDVLFTAPPSAQLSGPTANLTATLTSTRVGRFYPPKYTVTGFFLDQNGINNVNLLTPAGGITFNTSVTPLTTTVSMPIARLTVPRNRLTTAPQSSTSTEFRASYSISLQ